MQRNSKSKAIKEQLGPEICSNILFLHAVLGYDTTSHLFGIGKGTYLQRNSSQLNTFENKPNLNLLKS